MAACVTFHTKILAVCGTLTSQVGENLKKKRFQLRVFIGFSLSFEELNFSLFLGKLSTESK